MEGENPDKPSFKKLPQVQASEQRPEIGATPSNGSLPNASKDLAPPNAVYHQFGFPGSSGQVLNNSSAQISSPQTRLNFGTYLPQSVVQLNGNGGTSPRMIQGNGTSYVNYPQPPFFEGREQTMQLREIPGSEFTVVNQAGEKRTFFQVQPQVTYSLPPGTFYVPNGYPTHQIKPQNMNSASVRVSPSMNGTLVGPNPLTNQEPIKQPQRQSNGIEKDIKSSNGKKNEVSSLLSPQLGEQSANNGDLNMSGTWNGYTTLYVTSPRRNFSPQYSYSYPQSLPSNGAQSSQQGSNGRISQIRGQSQQLEVSSSLNPSSATDGSRDSPSTGGNTKRKRPQSSKYKGVCLHKRYKNKPFVARVWENGRSEHIGVFETEIEAAKAVDRRLLDLHGPTYTKLNFPPTKRKGRDKTKESDSSDQKVSVGDLNKSNGKAKVPQKMKESVTETVLLKTTRQSGQKDTLVGSNYVEEKEHLERK